MNSNHKIFNHLLTGLIGGLLLPLIAFIIYWQREYFYMSFGKCIKFLYMGGVSTQLMSLLILPNLLLFFAFIQFDKYESSKGVIFATILYTIANFILKFA